ncbi:MAG: DUF922 domain-containing protein [Flavobacteriaceae bacterium]
MSVFRLLILIVTLFFSVTQAQDIEKPWKADEKLTWSDFKGAPDHNHPYAAITYSGMSYGFSAEIINGKVWVKYDVKSFFVANKSWVKRWYTNDKELLKHEQLHFDITELFARKFRKRLSEMNFSENVKAEIRKVYQQITEEKKRLQKLYDDETDHSKNKQAQQRWYLNIDNELQKLIDFASK